MMSITDEQKERANYVNLPQFLMSHGFDLKRAGKEYIWKDHDSLHIRDNGPGERGQWFRFSENKGGDNIGFLREYMGMSFTEAVEALTGERAERTYTPPERSYKPEPVRQSARELSLAEADNSRRVFAYLCKTRGLDYDMLSALVKQRLISQEEKTGNVLFKYFDDKGNVIGAEKVGTSTELKFKGIATGSAAGQGFEVVRGTGEKAFFFESAIDMLSYLQMHDGELDNCRLVSMMGVKPNIVLETMARHNIQPENVFLCSDNDTAGNDFANRLREEYPDMKRIVTPDRYKDWNDMLRGIPKTEQKSETKEVNGTDMQRYGNEIWNRATDNRDKSIVTVSVHDFPRVQEQLEQSGINYYGYEHNDSVVMAINDKDIGWFGRIVGVPDIEPRKSTVAYMPPDKNIIGNAEYRYIPNKEYVNADRDSVLKMAEIMSQRGIKFSGRIYPTGKGTLTVSKADLETVLGIRKELIARRNRHDAPVKGQEVGTRAYSRESDTYHFISKLTPEDFNNIRQYLETSVSYHAVVKDNKVAFAVGKEDAPAFHRALESAEREFDLLHSMADIGLSLEQLEALSPVMHRLSVEDIKLDLTGFFDERYDDAQFGEMLALVNDYLAQSPAERYGEHSKLNDMLEAKSSFDRAVELSDFFSQHDFTDEQKAAVTAMFVGDVTRGQIDSIDETFTVEDIQAYDEILHTALQESDVADFLTAHKQAVIDREKASRVPTEEEVLFPKADLSKFLAKRTLSSDEWEDMAYPLFDSGYTEKHKPSDKAAFGYHLSEPALYDLAQRYHEGEDIRRELAIGLLEGGTTSDIEFVFEQGEISDRTFYYAENLRHSLHTEKTEDGYKCSFSGMERFVSFEDIGQAFLDRTREEYNDLTFWWVRDDILDAIPDISDEKINDLLTAFEGAAMHGWKDGDNQAKINRIKKALNDILDNEEHTEKAFAIIAKEKYHVSFEKESSIHFGLLGNGITVYDVSRTDPETHDYPTVAHISPYGVAAIYDSTLSEKDIALINAQAESTRKEFDERWSKLSVSDKYAELVDNADIITSMCLIEEKLSTEEKIEKYMPFVFFNEGERPQPEPEKPAYKIYQLREGEEYHGIRFESMDRLKRDGIQLNHEDYDLVYEGELDEFKGNESLESLYTKFNIDHPEDFRGHSLSVSDVIVITEDDIDTAYFCDSFGFTEMPEFFREKEVVQEKKAPAVSDLSVGDIIMYDGARREVEKISEKSIMLKDLDAPDYGGVLLSTSDVLSYEGWQQDMERKGFDILYKSRQPAEIEAQEEEMSPLDKAKNLINDFCVDEYSDEADFSDLHNVSLAYTTLTDDELPVQVTADLADYKLIYEFDGEVFNTEQYKNIEDMVENGLTGLDYNDLIYVPDEVIERHTKAAEQKEKAEEPVSHMSDASEVQDNTAPENDYPAVTLNYKGDAESLAEIKDKALSLGATVLVDNAEGTISVDTYENHKTELDSLAYTLGLMSITEFTSAIDKPLFTDADVIDDIKRDEQSSDEKPFWELPEDQGMQLNLFGEPEPLVSRKPAKGTKSATETAKSEFAPGPIVDGVNVFVALAAEIERGTGFVHGKFRVQDFYEKSRTQPGHPTTQELADFLKKEYGTGGHSGEGNISLVDTDSKGMTFLFENGEKFRHSWNNVAAMVEQHLRDNAYLSIREKEMWQEIKAERAAEENPEPYKIEVGDRFRNKATGVISEVVSLSGALPYYTDDCTVKRLSGAFEITENISYDKLLGSLYEYIGKADPEKSQPVTEINDTTAENVEEAPEEPEHTAETDKSVTEKNENFTITDDTLGEGGVKTKFRANVEAIRTLKAIEAEKRPATAEEKEKLSKYVGWGALAQAFDKNAEKWSEEYKELSELLTPEEYRQARASVNDAFYTSPTVIERQNGYKSVFK